MPLIIKHELKTWMIGLTGYPNRFVDNMKCNYYDSKFNKACKSMLTQVKEKFNKEGWPEPIFSINEPREVDTDNPKPLARTYWDLINLCKLHNEVNTKLNIEWGKEYGGERADDKTKEANY